MLQSTQQLATRTLGCVLHFCRCHVQAGDAGRLDVLPHAAAADDVPAGVYADAHEVMQPLPSMD